MLFFATVEQGNPIFGLFENNLLNWLFLIVLIVWLIGKFLPAILKERESAIETALKEAHQARSEGLAFLKAQEEKIENAEREAGDILVEAKKIAEKMKIEMEEQTAREMVDLSHKIKQEIAYERQLAVSQLRAAAAKAAVNLTRAYLPQHVTGSAKEKLLSQFVDQLKTVRD